MLSITSGLCCTSPNESGLQAVSNVRPRAESTPHKPPQSGRCTRDAITLIVPLPVALTVPAKRDTCASYPLLCPRGYIEVFASIQLNRLCCFHVVQPLCLGAFWNQYSRRLLMSDRNSPIGF